MSELLPELRPQVELLLRAVRDADFRHTVLEAYDGRCAVCGIQQGLVDPVRINPVASPEVIDGIRNSIALCGLHHRAYDHGVIRFQHREGAYFQSSGRGRKRTSTPRAPPAASTSSPRCSRVLSSFRRTRDCAQTPR